jgi:opine dehydrogenase
MQEGEGVRVAVLGSGAGASAAAFDFASHGHTVSLYDFEARRETIAAVHAAGGMAATGGLEGFAPIACAGHDLVRALDGVALVLVVATASRTRAFGERCRGVLTKRQTVLVSPGSCMGAIAFKQGAGLGLRDDDIVVAETSTLPYSARLLTPGNVNIRLKVKRGNFLAAVPAGRTSGVLDLVRDVYPQMEPGENVLRTSLENPNPAIHPAITIANAAQIERAGGTMLLFEEGATRAVGRLIESVDSERIALGRAFGLTIRRDPDVGYEQGWMSEPTYYPGYMTSPVYSGIKAQSSLDHRYFNEDVGYGLVFMQDLGNQIGVDTPTIDAVLRVASVMTGRDYAAEGKRTMKSLGLATCSAERLVELFS